jgi:acyl-homoserine-lactone acylase
MHHNFTKTYYKMRLTLVFVLIFCLVNTGQILGQKWTPHPHFVRVDSIQIVRDSWGVPHIFAPTDAEVAYGLAWANCEDDFPTVQKALLMAKGMNGRVDGVEGAKIDYALGLLKVKETAKKGFDSLASPEFRRYLTAFVAGVNRYAALHPEEIILKKAFPVVETDVIQGFILGMSFMSGIQDVFRRIMENKLPPLSGLNLPMGSNAYAVRSDKTNEGKSFIAINSHQPLEGMFSWYEAHLVSGEGLNILGGVFPGACIIGHGVNENIAWAHTLAYPDYADIFKLTVHPQNKRLYKLDGEWVEFEKFKVPLKVKLGKGKKGLVLGLKREALWSKFGPVMKSDSGYFAFNSPSIHVTNSAEQWLKMNKARNFAEFNAALQMQQLPCFNIVYADRFDTIAYLANVLLPRRNPAFEWKKLLPGDTSATLLNKGYYSTSELPRLINPPCGYVFNANNSPFLATKPRENLRFSDYPKEQGHQTWHWNRSKRLQQLFTSKESFTYNDFLNIKYQKQYPDSIHFVANIDALWNMSEAEYPELADAIRILKSWDKRGDTSNVGASIFLMTYQFFVEEFKKIHFNEEKIYHYPASFYADCVTKAKKYLIQHFGTLQVPLGKLQRLRRGTVDLPLQGMPDMLVATYSESTPDGTLRPLAGDSYIMMVKMGKNGPEIETVHAYGASARPDSPHFTDQMPLFVNEKRKLMTLDKKMILRSAEQIYHPK